MFYSSEPRKHHGPLPSPPEFEKSDGAHYLPSDELVAAVNVAIHLNQPLLVTGEPGTGKTELAHSVAWQLDLGDRLIFETKSTSIARDLFYSYDTLGRFHAAQTRETKPSHEYITYNALGEAIIRARDEKEVKDYLPEDFKHQGEARRSLVLIDEIDKAPRDFPNDLLNEISGMYFRIPELKNVRIAARAGMRPVVIITSNSEKNLPEPFLRRCVYFHIEFPTATLERIIATRLTDMKALIGSEWMSNALHLFGRLRDEDSQLQKKPATSELLAWLLALRRATTPDQPLRDQKTALIPTLCVLVKASPDREKANKVVEKWQGS